MVTGNICITGATGFIGSNLVKALHSLSGPTITAIARSKEACQKLEDLNTECYLDDGNTEHLIRFFRGRNFDTVIHLASLYLKEHEGFQIESLLSSNVLFGTRVLEASVRSSVRRFINTGTFWQHYENKVYSPVNLYAATKQSFEAIAQYYRESFDLLVTTLYLNDTYGPGDTRRKLLNIWNDMKESDKLDMSPGEQQINLLHIRDVISGYMGFIDLVQNGNPSVDASAVCVLKSKEEISLKQLAALFETISAKKLHINWGALPYKEREVMRVWDGGVTVPGWEPMVPLEEGLREFVSQRRPSTAKY